MKTSWFGVVVGLSVEGVGLGPYPDLPALCSTDGICPTWCLWSFFEFWFVSGISVGGRFLLMFKYLLPQYALEEEIIVDYKTRKDHNKKHFKNSLLNLVDLGSPIEDNKSGLACYQVIHPSDGESIPNQKKGKKS